MKYFQLIANNIDTMPLHHALLRQPELWDAHTWRTTYRGTPHQDVQDVWLRYSDDGKTADRDNLTDVLMDLTPIFHDAWYKLPQVRPIVFDLQRRVEGYELGRVLITKLAPGGQILPHTDIGGGYVDLGVRYHVVIQGLPGSLYHAGDETVAMLTGQCWWFDHKVVHSVVNNSVDDRIHLLVDFRIAP